MSYLAHLQRKPQSPRPPDPYRSAVRKRPKHGPGQHVDLDPAHSLRVQAKLRVGAVDDPAEREADRIARQVVQGAASTSSVDAGEDCDCVRREVVAKDGGPTETGARGGAQDVGFSPPFERTLHARMIAGGTPLPMDLRQSIEPALAADLSHIRIHTDSAASTMARSIGARAFTVNRHVFFDHGEFSPASSEGRHLLAHELVHTLQQVPESAPVVRRVPSSTGAKGPAPLTPRQEALSLVRAAQDASVETSRSLQDLDPNVLAAALLARLRDGNKSQTGAVLISVLNLLAVRPDKAAFLARVLANGMSNADFDALLADGSGPKAIARLTALVPKNASPAFDQRMKTYGRIEPLGAAADAIRANKTTVDTLRDCMDCVLHNVDATFGAERTKAMVLIAGTLQADIGVRLRDYAAALTRTGEARELVKAEIDEERCKADISFDPKHAIQKEADPFVFRPGTDPVYKPDPIDAMKRAIDRGDDGLYMFLASVQGHHAITIFAEKSGGKVAFYWNDPGSVKWNRDKGTDKLGHEFTRSLLAARVWANADDEHSRAGLIYETWRKQALKYERTKPVEKRKNLDATLKMQFDPADPKHVATVEKRRCETGGGSIRIWQLLPKQR